MELKVGVEKPFLKDGDEFARHTKVWEPTAQISQKKIKNEKINLVTGDSVPMPDPALCLNGLCMCQL